jgi:hypothetical protein
MVYMSGSKAARNQASIVNRPTCGGSKKCGLTPRIGWYMSSNPSMIGATNTQFGLLCIPNRTITTQKYGVQATRTGRM